MPAALVVSVLPLRLLAHLKTAGASKKAEAKKEKEAEAVLVRVHAHFISQMIVNCQADARGIITYNRPRDNHGMTRCTLLYNYVLFGVRSGVLSGVSFVGRRSVASAANAWQWSRP
jgi:hypothetical protein